MIKDIVKDDPILGQPCEPATAEDAAVVQDLLDTMADSEEAACLAANQIGVAKAVFVYRDKKQHTHAMFNPVLKRGLRPQRVKEGCLSHEEETKSRRYDQIVVEFDELKDGELVHRRREFAGWTAQMIQHMIDHCNGRLV